MAIPDWTWDEDVPGSDERSAVSAVCRSFEPGDIDATTDVFETLSNPVRLEILAALAARTEPVRYTELLASVSIEDKGKFNYHLRELRELVDGGGGTYSLNRRGRELVAEVLSEDSAFRYE